MKSPLSPLKYARFVSMISFVAVVVMLATGSRSGLGPALIVMFVSMALYCGSHPTLKGYSFTVWVFAFVSASMAYPSAFMQWWGYDLKNLIVPLIQIIMFGMGTTLSVADFGRVFKMPWPVCIGFGAQFIIMPLIGLVLALSFGFPKEVAAGVVLIGCCPSGVASNLMAYLAGGDVALSVTITSCTTLASPVLTPFLMDKLAGQYVQVDFLKMMFEIINMIIVPVVAGLIAHRILYGHDTAFRRPRSLALLATLGIGLAAGVTFYAPSPILTLGAAAMPKDGLVVGLLLISLVVWAKLILNAWLRRTEDWMDRALPLVSMVAICCIIAVITARSSKDLLIVGPWLVGSTILHNGMGYLLGYWLARAARLNESACRTVAFEVGMQNGGMASALAMNVLKSAPAALAPAIFGPWQNVSGSILATWWHRRPIQRVASTQPVQTMPPDEAR
jgi:BASS family bile acid:Na+ symporter